jgi:hypothetical protein
VRQRSQEFFVRKQMTGGLHDVDVPDNALFVDDEIRPFGIAKIGGIRVGIHHPILLDRIPRKIVQQWVGQAHFLGKGLLRSDVIDADPQHLGVEAFELGEIQLESQYLRGSDTAKGAYEEEQEHMLFALVI